MKTIEKYKCEVCGTEYAERKNAVDCEVNHKTPKKIERAIYQPKNLNHTGYPIKIDVLMSDGEVLTYKR